MEPRANTATKHCGKTKVADRGRESGERSRKKLKGHDFHNWKEGGNSTSRGQSMYLSEPF